MIYNPATEPTNKILQLKLSNNKRIYVSIFFNQTQLKTAVSSGIASLSMYRWYGFHDLLLKKKNWTRNKWQDSTSVGSNRKIPNLEPPEPLVNRTSNLPNLFLDFKTEPNLKRPNLEPLLILKKWLLWPPGSQIFA